MAEKHGGSKAIQEIQHGLPLTGLAEEEEKRVQAEYEDAGPARMFEINAIRLHTVANLYYAALQKAAEAGNLEKLDLYSQRFGWLAASANRNWREVINEKRTGRKGKPIDAAVVLASMRGEHDKNNG